MRKLMQFLQILKKNWLLYSIVFITIILIISAVLRAITPPQVSVPITPQFSSTNFNGQKTAFHNITFTGKAPEIPPQLVIFSFVKNASAEANVVNQLVTQFQLKPQPGQQSWLGTQYSLTKDPYRNFYTLTANGQLSAGTVFSKDQAVLAGQNFLQKILPPENVKDVQVVEDKIQFFQGSFEPTETDEQHATTIFVPFAIKINGFPLFYSNQREYPFQFMIVDSAQNVRVQQFFFYPQFIQMTPIQKKDTIPLGEAIQNINAGKASLIGAQNDQTNQMSLDQISSATIQNVSIEYRADDTTGIIYPFYRCSGSGTDSTGQAIDLQIITPAIQTTQ